VHWRPGESSPCDLGSLRIVCLVFASSADTSQNRHALRARLLGFRLSMQQIRLARRVVVGSRRFVAGFGAGFLRV
jgi:hypothetical protein